MVLIELVGNEFQLFLLDFVKDCRNTTCICVEVPRSKAFCQLLNFIGILPMAKFFRFPLNSLINSNNL